MKKLVTLFSLALLISSGKLFAQGGDNCATASASPITLPFTATGQSTCAAIDDFNNVGATCIPGGTIYTTGPDWLYYFCAPTTGQIVVTLSNIGPVFPYGSVTVWQGCPSLGNCIAGSFSASATYLGVTVNVVAGQCYYIMVDNWPTPACITYDINVSYYVPPAPNPACTNMDFETGTFTGWSGTSGFTISCGIPGAPYPVYTPGVPGMPSPHHTMMTGAGTDLCGGFPVVNPGGNFSVLMGDLTTAGNGGADMQQTFMVSASNANFTYYYAVVVEDAGAGHLSNEQPFFRAEVLDQNGNPIACGQYVVVGGPAIPGFNISATCGFGNVYYRAWTPVNVDLSAYVGQAVTVKFTIGDCCYGGHYGYAYVDATCSPMAVLGNDSICFGQSTTLTAPPGGASYTWSTGATTQAITVSPTVMTIYTVTIVSVSGPACVTVLTDTVFVFPPVVAAFTTTTSGTCSGGMVTVTNTSTGAIVTYGWNWGNGSPIDPAQNPAPYTYPAPGTYTITLTVSSGGCQDSVTAVVTVGGPAVTANFSAAPVCLNNPTTFTDLSTGGVTNWYWNFGEPSSGPANVSTLQGPSHTYSAAGTYTVTLVCDSMNPACGDTIQIVVTVNPLPTPNFSATTVCVGQNTTFTDLTTISTGSITTWGWNFGDPGSGPANISTLQNPIHVFTTAGTYNVILTATSNNGCQNTITLPITVNPLPVASYTATTVCVNNATAFTNTSTGSISWSWNFGDGSPLDLTQNPIHTYTVSGTYNTTLTVTGPGGCTATSTLAVTVNPGPTANFTSTSVCLGNPTTFTDLSTIPAGSTITGWSWNFGDGSPLDLAQNPIHTYATAGTFNASIVVTSNNGCTNTITIAVTVYPLPVAAFTNTTVCQGASSVFTDGSTISVGTITGWSWNFGDASPLNATQNPSHIYVTAGTYTVTLIVTSSNGCVDTIAQPITVNPLPIPNFTANDTNGCATHCVQFTDLSTVSPGTINQWAWQFGDGGVGNLQSPSHCYTVPGTYDVTLTVTTAAGCSATFVNNTYIVVYPVPTAEFSFAPQPTTYLNPTIYFTDLSNGSPIYWWWWYGDGDSTGNLTQNPIHMYPETGPGTYTATLIIENQYGCRDTVQHEVVIDPIFTFYIPNAFTPNGDGINDYFYGTGVGIVEYEMWIFDRWGNQIFHGEDLNDRWNGKVQGGGSNDIAQIDVYVWLVKLTDVFDKKHRYIGHVSLIK